MSKVIIVLGMHRSGTSLIAKALNNEISMGQEIIVGRNETQEEGYYESKMFHVLNGDILEMAGGDRKGLITIPPHRDIMAMATQFKDRIKDVIQFESRNYDVWGWKDPRTTLTLGLYLPYLENVHLVCMFRNPSDVLDSLIMREEIKENFYDIDDIKKVIDQYNHRLLTIIKNQITPA